VLKQNATTLSGFGDETCRRADNFSITSPLYGSGFYVKVPLSFLLSLGYMTTLYHLKRIYSSE